MDFNISNFTLLLVILIGICSFITGCPDDMFECKQSKKCIDTRKKCDGIDDCGDNSDEIECGLKCFQCNVFVRGTPWRCDHEDGMQQRDQCIGCLKTYTRSYLHNTFHDQILTDFESRLCILSKDYDRPDGCYPHETDGGYQKRCFCHSELCNSGTSHRISIIAALFASLVTLTLKMIL